ncbi:hypothetical protein GW17_00037408 [Ensete ventricosum]|nr:hypothetical protein GW17_00037408 [Ensete ventricosum]
MEMETVAVVENGPATEDVVGVGKIKKNRIQVSTNKKPLFFYVNLAKVSPAVLFLRCRRHAHANRYMQQYNEIELSALGMGKAFFTQSGLRRQNAKFCDTAIGTVVTVAEILKNNGLATEKSKHEMKPDLNPFLLI